MAKAGKDQDFDEILSKIGPDATATFDHSPSNPTEHASSEATNAATAVSDANDARIRLIELWVANLQVCDPAGLGVIVGLHRAARLEGKVLRLRNPSAELARVLEISDLGELLVGEDCNNEA